VKDGASEEFQREESRASEYLQIAFKSRRLQYFANETGIPVDVGEYVVVTVDRGEDLGRVVTKIPPCDYQRDSLDGSLTRIATSEDLARHESNTRYENDVLRYCAQRVSVRKLEMKLTGCEVQLDRRRIRIFFTADQRTDFRGLVRDLAAEFKARIEMRQIGVRDDAKQKDGIGLCGRRLCCSLFLNRFNSVTLKTVREQNLTPNPSKISGACSRLMCCLAYESDFYRRSARLYPETGQKVLLDGRRAVVSGSDIFRETVSVVYEDRSEEEEIEVETFHRLRESQRTEKKKTGRRRSGTRAENRSEGPADTGRQRPDRRRGR
jgi:cell fate regulator YaaT (PSP1 superfamily)